jgi:hypothetical protein
VEAEADGDRLVGGDVRLRLGGDLAGGSHHDPDEVQAAFFTPAQVHARRVPELRHLLDHRDTYRRRSFELLIGSLADEGRIRNAKTTEEAISMLEILHSGWIFESAFHPERVQQHFASFLAVAEGLTVD